MKYFTGEEMIIVNFFTDRYSYIKSAFENDKTSYLILKILFFMFNCNILYLNLLYFINGDGQDSVSLCFIALLGVLFIASFIWGSLLLAEIICRIRVNIKNNIRSQKGWVLIDSLAAVIFVGVAFVALLFAYTMATKGTATATNRTQATFLAQQTLETLKTQDNTTTFTLPSTYTTSGTVPFTVSVEPLNVSAIANDALLSTKIFPVQATVTWTDSTGGPASNRVSIAGYYYVK